MRGIIGNQIISQLVIGCPVGHFLIGRVGGAYELAVWAFAKALMVGVFLLGIGIGITQGMFKGQQIIDFPVDGLAWHKDFFTKIIPFIAGVGIRV